MQDIVEDVSEDGGRRTEDVDLIPNLLGHLDELFLGAVRNSFAEFFWRATPNKQIVELLRLRREYPLALLLVLKAEAPCSREEGEDVEFMAFQAIMASV